MKKLILLCISLATMFTVNAQVNFKDKNLAILEKIAFTTSYKTIKGFMKDNNYTFKEENETEIPLKNDDYLEVIFIEFKGPIGNTIMAVYNKKNKSFIATVNQIAAINTVFTEIELKEQLFKIKMENEDGKIWSNNSYKYQITTDKTDEKFHRILFISPAHPEFVK